MVKEVLLKIYNQFTQLDANKMSLIIYDPNWNYYQFIQDGQTIVVTALADLVIPTNNLRYAVLTPNGYADLMTKLSKLVSNDSVGDDNTKLVPKELGIDIYQSRTSKLFPYPIKITDLKVCDITNKLVISILYRMVYKKINNPLIAYKRRLKNAKSSSSGS